MAFSLAVHNRLNQHSLTQHSPCPTTPPVADEHRNSLGRFTKGCRPGPGRPRKTAPRSYVPPLSLYQRVIDMDNSVTA